VDSAEELPRGGRLVVPLTNPIHARELTAIELADEVEVYANVCETLLATDSRGNLVPQLCESWELLDRGRGLRLRLREDVCFQDGRSLTAEEVRLAFVQAIRRGTEGVPAYDSIEGSAECAAGETEDVAGLIVHSERELEIRLKERLPIYPACLTDPRTAIARALPRDEGRLIGTGPFALASRSRERVILERSDSYWKGTAPLLDAIEFRPAMDAASIAADPRFRRGMVETSRQNTYFVVFNTRSGPVVRDPRVRLALAGVVHTTDLVWQSLGRYGQPAACLIPPGILGHDPGKRRSTLELDEARGMIEAAGLELPIVLKAAVHPILRDRCESLLSALFALWAELGVEVSIETTSIGSVLEAVHANEGLDLLLDRWFGDFDDPDNFCHGLFHSRDGEFRSWFSSEASDRLFEEARAEARPAARRSLYRRIETLLQEAGIVLPLFHDIDYRIANPRVRGLRLHPGRPVVNYSELAKVAGAPTEPAPQRGTGGILHIPISGVVSSLDPSRLGQVEQAEVIPCIFESLTRLEAGARIAPGLAERFEVKGDGTRYTFHLRKDLRFHDDRRLTARDVRYTFERLLENPELCGILLPIRGSKERLEGKVDHLSGFEIHSATEFSIELEEPVSFFPVLLSHPGLGIMPEGSSGVGTSWRDGFVGTGPFRVVEFEPGRRLELERNPHYWRPGLPGSDRLVFTFGVPSDETLAGFRGGQFSLCSDLFPSDAEALRRDLEFASGYREIPYLSTYFVALNTHVGPFADKRTRRAFLASVDVGAVVRETMGRVAVPANGLIPPGLLGHDPMYSRDIETPHRTGSTGMLDGVQLTAAFHPHYLGTYSALTGRLTKALRETGATIQRMNETMSEYLDAIMAGTVDLVLGRWIGDYPDSDTFAHGILHTEAGHFGRLCGSEEIDRLVDQGRAEADPTTRHGVYRRIEENLARGAKLLPLFHEQVYRFARPEIEGLAVTYWAPVVRYEELRVRD
jgi:ABC-type transport system substrate-binding protein